MNVLISFVILRNRTPSTIGYGLYFYFSGLSLRKAVDRLSDCFIKRNHVSIWKRIQKYRPWKYFKNKEIKEYIIDETAIKAGSSELIWLWVIIESQYKEILAVNISKERNMFVAERFLSQVVNKYGLHSVSSDDGTWYPKAYRFFEDKSSYSLIFREKLDRKNNTIYKR